MGTRDAPADADHDEGHQQGVLGHEREHVTVEGVLQREHEAHLREAAVDLLRGLGEARLAVQRLAVLLHKQELEPWPVI